MTKQAITPSTLSPPIGPFSSAIKFGNLIFLSGQVGTDPKTGKLVAGDIEAQTEQAISNLQAVLAACNRSLNDALRVGVFLTDMSYFARMNAVYAKHFSAPFPARTTVAVAALPGGAIVEIDMWVAGEG
jgi:2-iminobutanoate/2-iminopropanoate deaminase